MHDEILQLIPCMQKKINPYTLKAVKRIILVLLQQLLLLFSIATQPTVKLKALSQKIVKCRLQWFVWLISTNICCFQCCGYCCYYYAVLQIFPCPTLLHHFSKAISPTAPKSKAVNQHAQQEDFKDCKKLFFCLVYSPKNCS